MGPAEGQVGLSELLQSALGFTYLILLLCESHRERKGPAQFEFDCEENWKDGPRGSFPVCKPGASLFPASGHCLPGSPRCHLPDCPHKSQVPSYLAEALPHSASASWPQHLFPSPGRKSGSPSLQVRPHSLLFPPLQTDQRGLSIPSRNPLNEGPCPGSRGPPQSRLGVAAMGRLRE